MNERTFSAWVRTLGYRWVGDEEMVKGFMTFGEAQGLIDQLVREGRLSIRG